MARNLSAQVRTETGKNSNNRLRVKGFIPAVMYSHGTAENIQVDKKAFNTVFGKRISESVIVDLDVDGKQKCHVFVKDYQIDPVSDEIVHLDFYKITEGEKIRTSVPLVIVGISSGARLGGVFEVLDRVLHVECLPVELPEKIELDVTSLQIGESIQVKDIKGPASMKILLDPEHVVAHVTMVKEEEVKAEEAAVTSAAPEAKKEDSSKDK
ncbi:MAG TPA: 50S ribosomal protein L25 [Spirochaetota bacterium]